MVSTGLTYFSMLALDTLSTVIPGWAQYKDAPNLNKDKGKGSATVIAPCLANEALVQDG